MNLKKILLIIVLVGAAVAAYVWFFVINKPHANIEDIEPHFRVKVEEIVNEFEVEFDKSQTKYNGKVVEITGSVDRVEPNDSISSVIFKVGENYEVYCQVYPRFNEAALKLTPKTSITIKGFFSGGEQPDTDFDIPGVLRMKKCSF